MTTNQVQAKVLAQALYEIRLLLSGYIGSQNTGDLPVRVAAHLAYALHNEALAVIEGTDFDAERAIRKVAGVDKMFGENFAPLFSKHISKA